MAKIVNRAAALKERLRMQMDSFPEAPHRLDIAKSRDQMLNTYKNLEIKRDWHDMNAFANVETAASSFYGGLDPRRRNEVADGGMVQEDRGAMANLSREFVHREYPRAGYYANPYIDDTVKGPRESE